VNRSKLDLLRWGAAALGALAILALASPARAEVDAAKAKELFATHCQKCHSVKSQGIEVKATPAEEGEEAEEEEPADLSSAGLELKTAAEMSDWLNKKLKRDEKLHRKKFMGTPAELKTLTDWLLTLKEPAKK